MNHHPRLYTLAYLVVSCLALGPTNCENDVFGKDSATGSPRCDTARSSGADPQRARSAITHRCGGGEPKRCECHGSILLVRRHR